MDDLEAANGRNKAYRLDIRVQQEGFVVGELVYDRQGKAVDFSFWNVNPTGIDQSGFDCGASPGRRISQLLPGLEASWFEQLKEVVRTGQPQRFEIYLGLLGQWFEVYAYPISVENRFGMIFNDITERKQADEHMKTQTERMRLLADSAWLLLSDEIPEHSIQTIAGNVMIHLGCDVFFSYLLDYDQDRLKLAACAGLDAEKAQEIEWLDVGAGLCGRAVRDGVRIVYEDIQESPDPDVAWVRSLGIQAYACHPLSAGEEVIGSIAFASYSKSCFSDDELELMKAVAGQISMAKKHRQAQEQIVRLNTDLSRRVSELNALIEVLPVSVCMTNDLECKDMEANPFMEELLGVERRTNISLSVPVDKKPDYKAVHDGRELPSDELPIQKAIKSGLPVYGFEYDIVRHDGVVINLYGHAVPLFDEKGQVRGGIGVFNDVTRLKNSEQKVRRQNETLEGINRIFQATLTCDSEKELGQTCLAVAKELTRSRFGLIAEFNQLGEFTHIALSQPDWESHHMNLGKGSFRPGFEDVIRGIYHRVFLDGKSVVVNHPIRHHYGSILPEGHPDISGFLGVPLYYEGRIFGMIGLANPKSGYTAEDLETAEKLTGSIVQAIMRKRTERALKESEEKYHDLFEAIHETVSIYEVIRDERDEIVDRLFRDGNHAFLKMVGVDSADWIRGQSIKRIFGEGYAEANLPAIREAMASMSVKGFESFMNGRDYITTVIPINGTMYIATSRDISDLKSTQRILEESEVRYRRIAEELREADRHKNEFMAILSHELRNPLAAISNSLYILDRAVPGGNQAKQAKEVIGRQISQLVRLVDDLLDATRISRNKIQLKRERVELNALILRTIEDFRPLYEKNGVLLENGFVLNPVHVYADPARLAQVVGNLLHNAAKFTDRGGNVCVNLEADPESDRVEIRVTDSGVGMTKETIEGLFRPFMQADTSLDRSRGGLGLGLAIAKGLVELHGGELIARSGGPGKGSEFVVKLPLGDANVPPSPVPAIATPVRARRVLIIEDRPDVAESLREVIAVFGHHPEVALNGPDGIEKAREFNPDVVLCDIGLPGMDGYEVARVFRSDEKLKDAYLVALSGYAQPEDLKHSAEAGFNRHMPKPPALDELERLLTSGN